MFASNCKSFLKFSFVDFHYFNHYSVCFFLCFASCAPLLVRFACCFIISHHHCLLPAASAAKALDAAMNLLYSFWLCQSTRKMKMGEKFCRDSICMVGCRLNVYFHHETKHSLIHTHKWTCSTSTSTNTTTIITLTHTHRRAHKVLMTETLCSH